MPSALPPAERDASKPNVLWICTDSQRWDTLGCLGNRHVRTPSVDALAAEGVSFTHAFVQSPLCTPSRGSFLTGRYPITNRLRQNGQRCPTDLRLMPRICADAGYVCGLAGKLHLNFCDQRLRFGPEWWKVDPKRWHITGSEERIHDGYHEFYWDHAPGAAHPASAYTHWLNTRGKRMQTAPLPECPLVHRGMDRADHQTTFCADMAISFIERHGGRTYPWLFSVNMFAPHYQFDPPAEYLDRYLAHLDEIPLPTIIPDEFTTKPIAQQRYYRDHEKYTKLGPKQHRLMRVAYWALCDHIDDEVGRMLAALERTGQRERTIVIFHSDHGELLGDHGVYIKDQFFYEPCVRVPLVLRWPGRIAAGQQIDDLVEFTDLAPTLVDALGLPAEEGMQGRSLWPRLTGAMSRAREDVMCEFYGANPKHEQRPRFATMLRTGTHKLVAVHGIDEGELYDLRTDPMEIVNRWSDPSCAELKCQLLKRLSDRIAFTADPLPERVGVY